MNQLIDTEIHQEPMAAAVILHWLAESHAESRNLNLGVFVPWAMLGLGLISTESTMTSLPSQKQSFAGWIRTEGARQWRGYTKDTILAWKDVFWTALAHGESAGIIELKNGRVVAQGKIPKPMSTSPLGTIRRTTRAVGGTIGSEQDDLRIASVLGLEFTI